MKTFIEVQAFGDFDMKYTDCIMTHPEKLDTTKILKEFYDVQGINSNTGLSQKQLKTVTQDFVCFLEIKGFTKLKPKQVYFSD